MHALRRTIVLPVLVAGLTIVSACGTSVSSSTKASTTTASKSTTTVGGATASTTTTGAAPTTAGSDSSTSNGSLHLTGTFCNKIKQISSASSNLFSDTNTTDPAAKLKHLKETFANLDGAYRQLLAASPAEIKADLQFAVTAFDAINTKVQAMKTYSLTDFSKLTSALDTPEGKKHSNNLDAYGKTKCGIDPAGGSSDSSTGTSS